MTDFGSGPGAGYTTTWGWGNDRICTVMVGDGTRSWESPPVRWVPGTEMAVRFTSRHKPAHVNATAYLVGDPTTGTVIYGKTHVPYELRRVEVDGRTMWEAVLSPPPSPDLYLDVVAHWRDQDGCGRQEVAWTFRAGLLPI